MSQVTPEAVWEAHLRDPEISALSPEMLEVLREYVWQLPSLLLWDLDKPATVATVLEAKLKFLKHCLENGFVKKAVAVERAGVFDEVLAEMMEGVFADLLFQFESSLDNLDEILKQNGMTDEELMLRDHMGLKEEAKSLYRSGELTIGRLLLVQPSVISKNDS